LNSELQAKSDPHLERRAVYFANSGTVALVLMAAIPAGLGLSQHAALSLSLHSPTISGQNAAATAAILGNQLPPPTLGDWVVVVSDGSSGGELVLCAGAAGAYSHVRLNARAECTSRPPTFTAP